MTEVRRKFLMPSAVAQPSIAESAYAQYPRLRGMGANFIDSSGGPRTNQNMSETYPADERDNPLPGRPTIEQFDPSMTPLDFVGESLHVLPKSDPYVGALKQQFIDSMTPEQQDRLRKQYDHSVQNFGEDRPFEKWRDASGHDAWFRGYVTKQWPENLYTPDQAKIFGNLDEYLKSRSIPISGQK